MKNLATMVMMVMLLGAATAYGQSAPKASMSSHMEVAGQFTTVYANAAPGECGCFFMYGGSAQVAAVDHLGFAAVFDFGATHASNINGNGNNLTLTTYMAGPRYYPVRRKKFSVYGQVLLGAAHTTSNYVLDDGTTRFGTQIGGGVDYRLSKQMQWRVVEANYLLTLIPNAKNEIQNQTRLSTGIVFSFGGK